VNRSCTNINTKIANIGVHFSPQKSGDYKRILVFIAGHMFMEKD
jgi:hypothetical protein